MAESDDIYAQDAQVAAEIEADVGVEQIADVYASGLLSATEKAGTTDAVLDELDAVETEALNRFPALKDVFDSKLISHDEKCGLIDRVFGGRVSPMLINFLKVVSRRGRLDCLAAIHRQARLLYDEMRGRVHVELTTATAVDPARLAEIGRSLRATLGGEPVLRHITDPEVIGGAVLRVGDTVHDGSVATQLKKIREQMIDRSAHEIQSRRDRFRHSAGN